MRQAWLFSALVVLAVIPPAFAHETRYGVDHMRFNVTLGHQDGVEWANCTLHFNTTMTGWQILRAGINQSCITQWSIRETDSRHLACVDRICETRATEWIYYLNETRICKDPCVWFLLPFYPEDRLDLVYTNYEAAQLTDQL